MSLIAGVSLNLGASFFASCAAHSQKPLILPDLTSDAGQVPATQQGIQASRIYGQGGNFAGRSVGNPSDDNFLQPSAVAVDANGNLYVSDYLFNRVLFFPSGSTTATRVYGQPDFSSGETNSGGISARSFDRPNGIAIDSNGGLYVADSGNNRVIFFPPGSVTATRVYGQPDFSSTAANNGGVSSSSLNYPGAVAVDSSGNLFVSDTWNNRVLYFTSSSTTASRVYGQPDFSSSAANNGGLSASSLSAPWSVFIPGSFDFCVADYSNNRVLCYSSGSTTATRVFGQPDFSSGAANNGGVSASSLNNPDSVTEDGKGNFLISDSGNNRVLYFPAGSSTATRVYGQKDLFSHYSNYPRISSSTLDFPDGIAIDSSNGLYIADCFNGRVLYFDPWSD